MNQAIKRCHGCGGEITPTQIAERKAGLVQGVLLCPECVEMKRREVMQARAAAPAGTASTDPTLPPPVQAAPASVQATAILAGSTPAAPNEEESISLVSDDEMPTSRSQRIRTFSEGSTLSGAHHESRLKRPLSGPQDGATRCRTFHAKLTDAGLANMDDVINEWLDNHPDVFIKSATSSIGLFEGGKVKETHIFINLFY